MAQQVNVKFVDDLDGSDAAGTVSFGLDDRAYEIDLSDDDAAGLRDSLACSSRPPARAADQRLRAAPAQKMTASSGLRPQALDREQTAAIRAWARQNGYQISNRGRSSKQSWMPSRPPTDPTTRGGGASVPDPPPRS